MISLRSFTLYCSLFGFGPVPSMAFELGFPVDCNLGQTCFIQQYVDRDPSAEARDFTCGPLSYDGHSGTDIRIPLERSIGSDDAPAILAAAPGTVTATRNFMPDGVLGRPGQPTLDDVAGRECGNGVVLDHGNGWITRYCHMGQFTIVVNEGDRVTRGQFLGRMGLSGATEFPHLEFSVEHYGETVDPFLPDLSASCGEQAVADMLWADPPAYQHGAFLDVGSLDRVPDFLEIKRGLPTRSTASRHAAALVLWAYAFGTRAEDSLYFLLTGPQGIVFERTLLLERTQAQMFRAFGRRTPAEGWPMGTYQAMIEIRRDGQEIDRADFSFTLTDN